jgi:outer membrane receptor for ferrienterochelin and colicins
MYTSQNELFHTVSGNINTKKSNTLLSINQAFVHPISDLNNDGFNDNIQVERTSFFSKWQPKGKPEQFLAIKGIHENRWNGVQQFLNSNIDQTRGSDSLYGESIITKRAELIGKNAFNDKLKVNYSFSAHTQDSYYGDVQYLANQYIGFTNTTYGIKAKKHDFLFGNTLRYQYYNDNTVATQQDSLTDQAESQFIPGVFVQDEWNLNQLSILAGSRLDYYSSHGPIYAPRLSVKWKFLPWSTLRLNYGTGFKIVNLFTEDHAFISGQRTVEIKENLNPERSQSLTGNLNQIYNALGGSGSIDIDAYYTYFTNKIIPDYSSQGKILYYNSDGNVISKGLNININQQITQQGNLSIGGNLQEVTQNEAGLVSKVNYAADWGMVTNFSWNLKKMGLLLAYNINYTGPMQLPEVFDVDNQGNPLAEPRPTRSKAFALHQFQCSKTIKQWSLYAGIQNVWNYRQFYSPLSGFNDPRFAQGFSPMFDTAYSFSPIHGREFYLGVRWSLGRKD